MGRRPFHLAFAATALTYSCLAQAETIDLDPCETVRGYFAALGRNDFIGALALTDGAAQVRTAQMVSDLQRQASQAHARVEVMVRTLCVSSRDTLDEMMPVEVRFAIDVVGHRWLFRRVARRLAGSAMFYVTRTQTSLRIVAINGNLAE